MQALSTARAREPGSVRGRRRVAADDHVLSITWRNVSRWDFQTYGAIARIDPRGCEHFNFPQQFSSRRSVRMGTSPYLTPAMETLAMNILAPFVLDPARQGTVAEQEQLRDLASKFAGEVLACVAGTDWQISRTALLGWIAEHAPPG